MAADDSQHSHDEYLLDLLTNVELEEIDEARLLQRLSWRWSFDAIQQRLHKPDGYVASRLGLLRAHNETATATSRKERHDVSRTPNPERVQRQANRMLETIALWGQRAEDPRQRTELLHSVEQLLGELQALKNALTA